MLDTAYRARLVVENDDKGSMFSIRELLELHKMCGVPLTFDFHHHK
jgi:UV DNA damage endonuclease